MAQVSESYFIYRVREDIKSWGEGDRFREEVKNDLLERKVDVQELYQPLSQSMRDIQTGIIECMDATLSEIKKSNTKVRFDSISSK